MTCSRIMTAFLLALTIAFGVSAQANMQVVPLIIEIGNAPGTASSFQVRNTGTAEIPVEVSAVRREVGPDGTVQMIPADGDFIVFPPQVVIQGQQSQSFRFQYVGDNDLAVSHSYYLYASQLPVDLGEIESETNFQARISFLYEYGVSVNLVPEGARPSLVVTGAKAARMPNGSPGVELVIENQGNRFGRASEHELTIKTGSGTTIFNSSLLKQGLNNGMWLPKQRSTVKFPLQKRATGNIEATFEYIGG